MSYRCQVCRGVSPKGTPRLVHVVFRSGPPRQIDREVPVCQRCKTSLDAGTSLDTLATRSAALAAAQAQKGFIKGIKVLEEWPDWISNR
jgi:hypothetical protein